MRVCSDEENESGGRVSLRVRVCQLLLSEYVCVRVALCDGILSDNSPSLQVRQRTSARGSDDMNRIRRIRS